MKEVGILLGTGGNLAPEVSKGAWVLLYLRKGRKTTRLSKLSPCTPVPLPDCNTTHNPQGGPLSAEKQPL